MKPKPNITYSNKYDYDKDIKEWNKKHYGTTHLVNVGIPGSIRNKHN